MHVCFKCPGDVELITGITPGSNVLLVANVFPSHLDFLQMSFVVGNTTATIRTKKELDAEVLADVSLAIWWMVDGRINGGITPIRWSRWLSA